VRTDGDEWSDPLFVSLTGSSVKYQIGAQSTDIILVFKSRRSVDGIMKVKFTPGADAAIAAGPVGRQAEAATDIQLKAEIYSYSRSKGVFAGVSLEGSTLQMDHSSNDRYYGKEGVSPDDIFAGKGVETPPSAVEFKKTLGKYSTASE